MKLENSFGLQTRGLFLYCYSCFQCGRSGAGLEAHHITGRDSNSAFNCCPLCKICHNKIGHTQEEEKFLTGKVIDFLSNERYQPNEKDWQHLRDHPWLVK